MQVNIDADIITYRIGFTTEKDEEWVPIVRCDELLDTILVETKADLFKLFLTSSDKSNFRFSVYPQYKANRTKPKPVHYNLIREHLVSSWGAEIIFGMEADDALGIEQQENTCICSIDKDLLQIPGIHYNFVKKEWYTISKEEGIYNFYYQLLKGDTGDNIPGCPGIGDKKIQGYLHPDMDERQLFETTLSLYYRQYEKKGLPNFKEDMLRNGQLLKIKRTKEENLWTFPFDVQ